MGTLAEVCKARCDYDIRQGHINETRVINGVRWHNDGNNSAPWRREDTCSVYRDPDHQPWVNYEWFGIQCEVIGCPDQPEPTPTPPEPTPTPAPGECSYTHFNLVWLCAEPSKPGCLNGKDWGRPGIVHINRDGKFGVCSPERKCVRAHLTAVLFNGTEKIEHGHVCFPGPLPADAWDQTWDGDNRFDCGHPWGEFPPGSPWEGQVSNWNNGSCNIDFAARNDFKLCAFGVCGETYLESMW